MKKTRETTVEKIKVEHDFYCDECNEFLGTAIEEPDGWYKEFGEYELKIYVDDGWYYVNKHLCHECRKAFIENVKVSLKNLGFEKEKDNYPF
jgi:hypothetical protein